MDFKVTAACTCAAGLMLLSSTSTVHAALAYGLTDDNSLVSFETAAPTSLLGVGPLRNGSNQAIQDLIGIDFRPLNNTLYGVGKFGAVYTINTSNAVATLVTTLQADVLDTTDPYSFLGGTRFGFDFNPTVDRLRINSDLDQNLRINVATGATTTDTPLAYAGTDVNAGQNPSVVAAAYTNNDNNPTTGTTLYVIDSVLNVLATQNPANNGTLNTVGAISFDTSSLVGFDIHFDGVNNVGYAGLQNTTNGVSQFFTIDLATGNATLVGTIGGGDFIDGIAVAIPEPATASLLTLAAAGFLTRRRRI